MKKILYLMVFLILINLVYGATIHGTVYDLDLNKVDNVVIEVNSVPAQRVISKDGSYLIDLNPGKYKITARYINAEIYYTEEELEIVKEGDYVIDLFLFPSFEEEDELIEDTNIDLDEDLFEKKNYAYIYLIVSILIIILIIILFKFKSKKGNKKIEEKIKEIKEEKQDLNQIIEIIKKEGGRATQKEIRNQIPLSEAKISLMIAELEEKGKIRKIKKGRGNILILNE